MEKTSRPKQKRQDRIQSLQVGMRILDILSTEKRPLKFQEILEKSEMTQSNLYKYLNTLKDMDFIFHHPDYNTYYIGKKIIEYGTNAINNRDIADQLTPYLAEIRKDLNETVHLNTYGYEGPRIVKMFTSTRPFNIVTEIGTILPIHSAAGKLFATFPNDPYELWKQTSLEKDRKQIASILDREKESILEYRIAFAEEVLVHSNSSMAVPILDFDGRLLAAIIVVGFKEDIPSTPEEEKAVYLRKKGEELSKIFGWKGKNNTD